MNQNPNTPNNDNPPFGETELVSSSALESLSRAEIDVAISTARRYPRELSTVKKNMLTFATLDQETAEGCFYTLPRGGKNIQGPSVRLAEIAVSCYQNIRAGSRILQTVVDGPNPHVVVQAVAMDLEKNVSVSIEKRRRITKKKAKNTIDEDDINLAANAGSAIAFRDAVFKVIPLALIKPVFEQAKKVAIGDAQTFGTKRAKWFEHFGKMGIIPARVLARLERKAIDDVALEDIGILIGINNALKDNEITLEDAFPLGQTAKAPDMGAGPGAGTTGTATTQQPAKTADKPPQEPPKTPQETPGGVSTPPATEKPAVGAPAEAQKAPETTTAPVQPGNEQPVDFKANPNETEALQSVRLLMMKSGVTEEQLMTYCRRADVNMAKPDQKKLNDLSEAKLKTLGKAWHNVLPAVRGAAQ